MQNNYFKDFFKESVKIGVTSVTGVTSGSKDRRKGRDSWYTLSNIKGVTKKEGVTATNKGKRFAQKNCYTVTPVTPKKEEYPEKIKLLLKNKTEEDLEYFYGLYEERAAIIEYEANYNKNDAQELAFKEVEALCLKEESEVRNNGEIKDSVNNVSNASNPANTNNTIGKRDSVSNASSTNKSISSIKDYYLEKKREFIDEHDLRLYCDDKTVRIEFIGEVYKTDSGYIKDAYINMIVCLYNKKSRTHLVPSTGLVYISTDKICHLDKLNEISKYKPWDYIKVTGKLRMATIKDNSNFIDIPYIEASNITSSTKQALNELIKC